MKKLIKKIFNRKSKAEKEREKLLGLLPFVLIFAFILAGFISIVIFTRRPEIIKTKYYIDSGTGLNIVYRDDWNVVTSVNVSDESVNDEENNFYGRILKRYKVEIGKGGNEVVFEMLLSRHSDLILGLDDEYETKTIRGNVIRIHDNDTNDYLYGISIDCDNAPNDLRDELEDYDECINLEMDNFADVSTIVRATVRNDDVLEEVDDIIRDSLN